MAEGNGIQRASSIFEFSWKVLGVLAIVIGWFVTTEVRNSRRDWETEGLKGDREALKVLYQAEKARNDAQDVMIQTFSIEMARLNERFQRLLDAGR